MIRGIITNQGASQISTVSSSRLSFEFSVSSLSLASANPQRHSETANTRTDGKETIPQRESTNQTHALNVFAARKSKILSQGNEKNIPLGRKRAVSIHRSHSVWREVSLPAIVFMHNALANFSRLNTFLGHKPEIGQ